MGRPAPRRRRNGVAQRNRTCRGLSLSPLALGRWWLFGSAIVFSCYILSHSCQMSRQIPQEMGICLDISNYFAVISTELFSKFLYQIILSKNRHATPSTTERQIKKCGILLTIPPFLAIFALSSFIFCINVR